MINNNKPLSVADLAEFSGLSKAYIYKLIHHKQIPHYKPNGGKVYFKLEEVKDYFFSGKVEVVS